MYNIAYFLLVQLSLSTFTLIKSQRNSATVVTLSSIYFDMKVWSFMCVVNVQNIFVQYKIWNLINWYTQTTNSFAVVCVVNISNTNITFCDTLRNVLLIWHLVMFNLQLSLCLIVVVLLRYMEI